MKTFVSYKQKLAEKAAKEAEALRRVENPSEFEVTVDRWIKKLLPITKQLLEAYLEQTEKWAKEQVVRNIARAKFYCEVIGSSETAEALHPGLYYYFDSSRKRLMPTMAYYAESKFYHNSPASSFKEALFVAKSIKEANEHYQACISKLAYRLTEKKLHMKETKVEYNKIGINLDITLSDSTQFVKAWTIIASGPIQRPHYRYLIK